MAIQALANEYGCQQALWLYGEEHNLTEVGAMNLFTLWINEQGGIVEDEIKVYYAGASCSKHR